MKYATLSLIIAICLFAACNSGQPQNADASVSADSLNVTIPETDTVPAALSVKGEDQLYNEWRVAQIGDSAVTVSGDAPPALTFRYEQTNSVTGNTGCNRLSGNFEIASPNKIKFTPLITTKMMCPDIQTENKLLDALSRVTSYSIKEDNNLALEADGETIILLTSAKSIRQ